MAISNSVKANISFSHQHKIKKVFDSYIKGELHIDHFSLNLFFGNGQSIFLSPTPKMAEALCKCNFVDIDSNYKKEVYSKHKIYPWRSVQSHKGDEAINFIKEERFSMRSGMMIVRDLGQGRYVMYSIATHKPDNEDVKGLFYFLFHCKANYIAEMGDFMYDQLLPTINEYTSQEGVLMPKIKNFEPINLESSLSSPQQREMFDVIQNTTNTDLVKIIQKRKAPILRLIDGGRVKRGK